MNRFITSALCSLILVVISVLGWHPLPVLAASCIDGAGPSATFLFPETDHAGLHARLYAQSGELTLCPGHAASFTFAYVNSGSLGWYGNAYLGSWGPTPGQDQPSGFNPGSWPAPNRPGQQTTPYVGPGQIAWFTIAVQAPATAGDYRLYVRPLIEGTRWLEDYGAYVSVHVPSSTPLTPACSSDFCYPRLGLAGPLLPYSDCQGSTDIGTQMRLFTCLPDYYVLGHAYTAFGQIVGWRAGDLVWAYQHAYTVTGAYTQSSCTAPTHQSTGLSLQTSLTSTACGDVLVVQATLQ